jgi:hypothetical protein
MRNVLSGRTVALYEFDCDPFATQPCVLTYLSRSLPRPHHPDAQVYRFRPRKLP